MVPDSLPSEALRPTADSFLNEHQRRHFDVFLAMLDDALLEVADLAQRSNADAKGKPRTYDQDLPPEFAASAAPLLESIREQMGALRNILGIQPQHRSTERAVKALLTAELVRLDDSYARKLGGYGAVDQRAQNIIDPILDEIRSSLVALLDSLGSSTQRRRVK